MQHCIDSSKCLRLVSNGKAVLINFRENLRNVISVNMCIGITACAQDQPPSENSTLQISPYLKTKLTTNEVKFMQKRCTVIRKRFHKIKKTVPIEEWKEHSLKVFRKYSDHLMIDNGVLWYQDGKTKLLVALNRFLVEIVSRIHTECSHPGKNKLLGIVGEMLWNPSVRSVPYTKYPSTNDLNRLLLIG